GGVRAGYRARLPARDRAGRECARQRVARDHVSYVEDVRTLRRWPADSPGRCALDARDRGAASRALPAEAARECGDRFRISIALLHPERERSRSARIAYA